MLEQPTMKYGSAKWALGASVLVHGLVTFALLRPPPAVRPRAPAPERAITFFAPSLPVRGVAEPPRPLTPAKAAEGLAALPAGPQGVAQAGKGAEGRVAPGSNAAAKAPQAARGVAAGAGTNASTLVVYPFGEGMTRPQLLSGRDPQYTSQALARGIEGTLVARCVIDRDGQVRNCRVVQGVEGMNEEVLAALESRQYSPVFYQGKPVDVDYVFRVRLVIQAPPAEPNAPPAAEEPQPRHGRRSARLPVA